jgi:hypothetical protein
MEAEKDIVFVSPVRLNIVAVDFIQTPAIQMMDQVSTLVDFTEIRSLTFFRTSYPRAANIPD